MFFAVSVIHGQVFQFVSYSADNIQIINELKNTTLTLCFDILDGYHIQLEEVEDDNLLATKIDFEKEKGVEILDLEFSSKHLETITLDKKTTQVLSKTFKVSVKIKVSKKSDPILLMGKLFYQTCDDFKCYFPRELLFTVPLNQ